MVHLSVIRILRLRSASEQWEEPWRFFHGPGHSKRLGGPAGAKAHFPRRLVGCRLAAAAPQE